MWIDFQDREEETIHTIHKMSGIVTWWYWYIPDYIFTLNNSLALCCHPDIQVCV